MDKNKRIILILGILTIIFTIMGGTFAYWSWISSEAQKTNIVFTVERTFSCAADGGGSITNNSAIIVPTLVNSNTTGNYIKREVKVTPTINQNGKTIYMDLWLDINKLDSGLSNSVNFKYAFTTSSTSNTTGVVASGNFNGKVGNTNANEMTSSNRVNLLSNKSYNATTTDTYYLWIWLDAEETSSDTMDQSFSLSLNGSCGDAQPASAPDLDDGMIPVVISNNGIATTVSKDDNNWYNYNDKEWANVVLVNNNSRSKYLNTTGVTVKEDDILAYYVWIPRYKYKLWTTTNSSAGHEQEIEIVFENKKEPKTLGTQVGEYRTHPAFTFGDTELNGIWVGKFETTGTVNTPTIKGNNASLVSRNVSTQFTTAQKLGTSTYGSTSKVDSHMMKNSEWGAVAYLSHSKYGTNKEIRINNYYNNGFLTGCGANTENEDESNTCGIIYGKAISYPQSTTGNVTGIFDMSGGAWEYVMGYYSGASTTWGATSSSNYAGFSSKPASKYFDDYTTTNPLTACNGGICYGHGLSEVNEWYGDYAYFVNAEYPWFLRGGHNTYGANAGAFYFAYDDGNAFRNSSFRVVLSPIGA